MGKARRRKGTYEQRKVATIKRKKVAAKKKKATIAATNAAVKYRRSESSLPSRLLVRLATISNKGK